MKLTLPQKIELAMKVRKLKKQQKQKNQGEKKHPRTRFVMGLLISCALFFGGGVVLPPGVVDELATEAANAYQGD